MGDSLSKRTTTEQRVLLLVRGDEGSQFAAALSTAGLRAQTCSDVDELLAEIRRGGAAAVLESEFVGQSELQDAMDVLGQQAGWSDFALIVLRDMTGQAAKTGETRWTANGRANVAVLERPVSTQSLVSVVKLAVRARGRQYAQRQEQVEHARSQHELHARSLRLGERIREQRETLRLLRDVATAANFATSVEEALSFALAQVCRHTGWMFGHAYLPAAEDGDVLQAVDASYEHAPGRFTALRAATERMRVRRGELLVGRVYATGQPEWARRLDAETDSQRAKLGAELGVAAIAAFPVLMGTEVVGVLEFLSDAASEPSTELLEAMSSIGTQLGRVIERDRLDRALRDSVWLIEKISDTSPMMIRVYDLRRKRYIFVNRQMAQFIGMSANRLLSSSFDEFLQAVHPDDVAQVQKVKDEVQERGGSTVAWQARMRDAQGQWRWVRTWSVSFRPSSELDTNQVLSISMDVTEEVENQERLRQTERLTSIGTLAAGIAHEVNNPLASVVMTAQLLRRRKLDPQIDEMLKDLIEDARRCGRIVRNVQRFAQQEPSDRRPVDLNTVVRAAEELSRTELRRAGVGARLDLAEELPLIDGDATELEQVAVNLITNAAHASQTGQEVEIRTRATTGAVQLTVEDKGRGMTPEARRHAFDPFFTTRGREGGTGLGLSIAHGIIEDHGGTIQLESELGQGTRVTVVLPVADTRG